MQQTTQILQFDQVSISFEERSILESMSFKVHLGEFVYIVGKTGSGKSTLLKMIYADLMPTRGSVMVAEMVTSSLSVEQILSSPQNWHCFSGFPACQMKCI